MDILDLDKNISLEELLVEYKIPGVGPKLAKSISDKVRNAATLRMLLEDGQIQTVLKDVQGIGDSVSDSIIKTLMSIDFFIALEDMEEENFEMFKDETIFELGELCSIKEIMEPAMTIPTDISSITSLKGMNIVITGTLSLPRKFFETTILKNGGNVQSTVNSHTDILIHSLKDRTSTSKYKSALNINRILGFDKVKIITEPEWNKLVNSL